MGQGPRTKREPGDTEGSRRSGRTDARLKVKRRSGGRCEAFVTYSLYGSNQTHRCTNAATEVHHLLTKARGGANLDKVGEDYHLIDLCSACHAASDGGDAYVGKMLIEGDVQWDKIQNRPVYRGPNEYLKREYG